MADSRMPTRVRVVEVGPRDGLQNEKTSIPTDDKVAFIDLLSASGLGVVEATSFVHPKAIPQLADAAEVYRRIQKRPGVRYPVLVPNARGMQRALESGVKEIAVFTAASDAFNQRNINATIDESLANIAEVMAIARRERLWTRGYISACFGCPYQGDVAPGKVVEVSRRLLELGVDEVCLGDTIGVSTPGGVDRVLEPVLTVVPLDKLGLHFHDTRGTALANTLRALQYGCWIFDSSAGGLGGCPYAPGAAGNLATEDLLYMLHGMDIETSVDLAKVMAASKYIAARLERPLTSKVYQAELARGVGGGS
jgi:isopropylmalate/homocitrate/citramalate synthase